MDDDLEIVEEVINPTVTKQLSLDVSQEMRNAILKTLVKENPNLHGKKLNLNIVSKQVGQSFRNPSRCNFSYSILKRKPVPVNRKRFLQDPINLNNNCTRKPVLRDIKDVPKSSSLTLISLSSDEEDDLIDLKDGNLSEKDEMEIKGGSPLQIVTDPLSQCSLLTVSTDEDFALPEVTCVDDGNNLASQDLAGPPVNLNVEFISIKFLQGKCSINNFLAEVKKLSNPLDSLKFNANWELEAVSRQALVEAFGEPFVTDILCNTNACEDSLKPQSPESSNQNFEEIHPPRCEFIERNVFVDAESQTEEVPSVVPEAEFQTNDQSSLDICTFNSQPPCGDLDVDDLLDSEEEQEVIHEGPSLGDLPRTELLSFLGLCSHEEADRRRAVTLSNCVKLPRKSKRVKSKKC